MAETNNKSRETNNSKSSKGVSQLPGVNSTRVIVSSPKLVKENSQHSSSKKK